VANGVGTLAAATLGTCVALLSLRPAAANKPKALSAWPLRPIKRSAS